MLWCSNVNAIEIRDLSLSVDGKTILNGINLYVEENTITIITGPSGSGKTTLLKVLAGYIPNLYKLYSVSGVVKVFNMQPLNALLNGLVTYIPQDTWSFLIGRTVCDELTVLGLKRGYSDELCLRPIETLSDGELYDMLIQLSLSLGAKLILVDEPSTHLDYSKLVYVMEKFRGLVDEGRLTVVVADHGYQSYAKYVDAVIEIAKDSYSINRATKTEYYNHYGGVALRVDDVWVKLGDRYIVEGLSLKAREGEVIALYGRNGVGKTTLIKVLAGFIKPDKGSIRRFGSLFYIPQRPIYWFSTASVIDELKLYSKIYSKNLDVVENAIEFFNLSKIIDRDPYTLSVGEARRLSFALSYIASPKILLIDEPTLGLDNNSTEILYSYLDVARRSSVCIIMATHSRLIVEQASRVVELGNLNGCDE